MQKTFENVRELSLDVKLPAGRIAVDARETDRVELSLEPQNDAARELLDGGGVTVDVRQRGESHELVVEVPERRGLGWLGRGPQFSLEVTCPQGARATVRTASADFEARGALGSLELKTASGDVQVERVDGPVKASSASGDLGIQSAVGPAELNTASGDIELGRVERSLRANLVSGDLSVSEAGESVNANSVSGDQQLDAVAHGRVELHTVSGDIEVRVRRGIDVWMDVRSISGDMHSNLTPTEGPSSGEGELLELHVKSVSGDVHIDHAPAAAV